LKEAQGRLAGAVMGGISQDEALQAAGPDAVLAEYRGAMEQTGGRGWLLAPGCSIPPGTPSENLRALREAVEATQLPST
jgi:uroporphyrinogen decarboxylase